MERWPEIQDLRSWLGLLADQGELGVVRREVDPEYELAGFLSRLDGERAVLFERVAGSSFRAVGNTFLGRRHIATALGCGVSQTAEAFDMAVREPRPCSPVEASAAHVLANRLQGEDLLGALPIPVHHGLDGGRYLSAGVVVARDPRSGATNLSINRLQVSGPREFRALILPGRLRAILTEAERAETPLDVAILLGVDPLVTLASQVRPMLEVDELELCSALRGSPLEVTRTPSVDLIVPARTEIVIEARIRPGERQMEGPFGEFPRTYGPPAPAPVLDVLAVWHRDDAIFQTILSAGREHLIVGGIPREADLLRRLKEIDSSVQRVRMTEGGSCRFHAVFSIHEPGPGHVTNALLAAFATNPVLKHVVAVDTDVDVFSDEQVEWAIATRVQADRDVLIVPGAGGSSLDPSAHGGMTAKMGIDATAPADARDRHARMQVPGAAELDIAAAVEQVRNRDAIEAPRR